MKKLTTIKTFAFSLLIFSLLLQNLSPLQAQTPTNDINAQIRKEGMENSQIMRTIHFFSDVYGPRLTGSPNHKAAANWAVKQMLTWGFDSAQLEAWDFGHPGWVNERASGFITAPVEDSLVFEVLAWTPGTKGAVKSQAFQMNLPERPTQEELTAYFNSVKSQVADKMILMGKPAAIPVNLNPPPKRLDDETVRRRLDPTATPQPFPAPPTPIAPKPGQLSFPQIAEQLDKFLIDNRAAVRINDAGREHGQIRAFNNRTFDVTKVVPTVVMRNEDFGRIGRLLADGTAVSL